MAFSTSAIDAAAPLLTDNAPDAPTQTFRHASLTDAPVDETRLALALRQLLPYLVGCTATGATVTSELLDMLVRGSGALQRAREKLCQGRADDREDRGRTAERPADILRATQSVLERKTERLWDNAEKAGVHAYSQAGGAEEFARIVQCEVAGELKHGESATIYHSSAVDPLANHTFVILENHRGVRVALDGWLDGPAAKPEDFAFSCKPGALRKVHTVTPETAAPTIALYERGLMESGPALEAEILAELQSQRPKDNPYAVDAQATVSDTFSDAAARELNAYIDGNGDKKYTSGLASVVTSFVNRIAPPSPAQTNATRTAQREAHARNKETAVEWARRLGAGEEEAQRIAKDVVEEAKDLRQMDTSALSQRAGHALGVDSN